MKPRSWIRTMAASALSSPRAAFRKSNSSAASLVPTSSAPPIPLSMVVTLTRVVRFLNESHLEEEGLYSKPGVGLERKELLRSFKSQHLPDLSVYSPHSIASVVKEILRELYEPLVHVDISRQLLEAVSGGRIDEKAEHAVREVFKQIRFTTREFLQVFLVHLNNVAANGSSRMSVTNLALHVGIALVRPTEDKAMLNSKTMIRDRKCVAEFLIRQASSLPYDCATEMNIPAIPELVSTPSIDTTPSTKDLHFVQVTWDAGESSFTPAQLEEMFSKFGDIKNLGINDQGNRAIVAYVNAAGAETAERASTPSVRIRRRRPRQGEKRREYSSHSPEHSRTRSNNLVLRGAANVDSPPHDVLAPEHNELPTSRLKTDVTSRKTGANRTDDTIVVEDIEDDQLEHGNEVSDQTRGDLHAERKEESPHPSADDQFVGKEDQSVPIAPKSTTNHQLNEGFPTEEVPDIQNGLTQSSESRLGVVKETPLNGEAMDMKAKLEANVAISPQLLTAENENQNATRDSDPKPLPTGIYTPVGGPDERSTEKPSDNVTDLPETSQLAVADDGKPDSDTSSVDTPEPNRKAENVADELLETTLQSLDLPHVSVEIATPTSGREGSTVVLDSTNDGASIEALRSRFLDMEKILGTSTAALSATKLSNEFERAVLQLHKQILDMVSECLVLAGGRQGESKTQVKILEVEVRAGQELLRLHKTQYEKERVELEEEITTLRVGRTETERLCAELRTDLRKCRSELACHVANATDIQRQKSALEEKLAASENKLYAKEVSVVKLQAEYDKMHRIAAEAQMRAEKFKQGDFDGESMGLNNQIGRKSLLLNTDKVLKSGRASDDLPHTSKLFSKLSKQSSAKPVAENQVPQAEVLLDTPTISSRPSNVAALDVMKQQMARDIQEQIATTRAALREMEVCSSSGKTLEEEEGELRQLQQELAARAAEMNTAMNDSRTKLKELLDPAAAPLFRDDCVDYDEKVSNQEPTIFDSTALVNELIARAENAPAQCRVASNNEFSSYSDVQNAFGDTGRSQQLAQYHRPVHEAQSVLYKRWTADRARKMAQLANYRDQQGALRAQQSMQTFQQALAETREQR
ncbi:hypothetical protein PHYPSEUDO_013925 [Phytophthora pseudosyringae]|uniref:Rho-GAP domain-containing protein n=1 Tax=Phytophthora pseudosyringae TaxID=221518 RepID=A0A8T1V4R2_9STRA|nr:hypothetical protein PHYPSEUDO_013925 [Phytophthora pseudosyringae]